MENTGKKSNKVMIAVVVVSLLIFLSSVVTAGFIIASKFKPKENDNVESVHMHAAFQIYMDGELLDYSADEYMHLGTCSLDEDHTPTTVKERVHLHENFGDIAHVHAAGVTWREIFESLEIESLLEDSRVSFMLNNETAENLLDSEIGEYDYAVFIIGESNGDEMLELLNENIVTVDYIKEAEKAIESCGG